MVGNTSVHNYKTSALLVSLGQLRALPSLLTIYSKALSAQYGVLWVWVIKQKNKTGACSLEQSCSCPLSTWLLCRAYGVWVVDTRYLMNDSLFYLACAKTQGGRGRVAGSEAVKRMDALILGGRRRCVCMGSWAFVCKARGMKTLPSLCVLGGRRGMGQGILGPVTGNEMLYERRRDVVN